MVHLKIRFVTILADTVHQYTRYEPLFLVLWSAFVVHDCALNYSVNTHR